jgi:signal transduction histidine kinase
MFRSPFLFTCAVFLLAISCEKPGNTQSDHTLWADSVCDHSMNLMDNNSPALSMPYLDSAYQTLSNPSILDLWKKYHVKANYYTHYDIDFVKRKVYVDSMLSILKNSKEKYKTAYSNSLYAKATLFQEEKKYNLAFKFYYDGLNFSKGSLDNCAMSDYTNALGVIRYRQEQYPQAIPYLKQALQEITACTSSEFRYNFIQHQSVLNTIALCFEKSGNLDSALFYYNKALVFIKSSYYLHPEKQNFMTVASAVVEGNLGGTYAKMNRFSEAEKHLLTNIRLNDKPGFGIEDAQTARLKLAKLYIDHRQFPKASAMLSGLHSDLTSGRGKSAANSEIWENWYMLKSMYYDKTGDFSTAYLFSKRYQAYKDSLDQLQTGLKKVDIDQVLRDHEQKYQLTILEKSSQLKNIYMGGLSVFLVMVLCIASVIWLSYKRSRTNVKNLTVLNGQMQQALSALENSQRENTRLMNIVAHDLRNPIGSISSLAEMMLDDDDRSGDDREALTLIQNTGKNSLELVNNLLHINLSSGDDFKREQVNLADLVQHCADMLSIQAARKEQKIKLSLKPAVLSLNYEKMWRVISNLLSNAIKFSPVGSEIKVSIQSEENAVQLVIADEGIGMPKEFGNKIFDAFTGLRRKGTAGEESFGLGLSITKQIVEAHGGTISFDSIPDKGTTFKITLPVPFA